MFAPRYDYPHSARLDQFVRQSDESMGDSRSNFSIRSLLALIIVLGLTYLVLDLSGRFYYDPICQRYADDQQLTYISHTTGWSKWRLPAECFFRDKRGNSTRVEVATLSLTSGDAIRWVISWIALIAGVGGSVWLASLVSGDKPRRRRSRERHHKSHKD